MVKEGALGDLISEVLNNGAAEQWRYVIMTPDYTLLGATKITEWAGRLGI